MITLAANIVWVGHQLLSYATAPVVGPQYTLWALDEFAYATTTASTGIFARFIEDIMAITRDQEPGLHHVDTELFTFHASLPRIEVGDTLLISVRLEHQVIRVDKFSQHQHQNDAQ